MKKMLAALLAALMVLSLAACGASSAPAATTAPAAAATERTRHFRKSTLAQPLHLALKLLSACHHRHVRVVFFLLSHIVYLLYIYIIAPKLTPRPSQNGTKTFLQAAACGYVLFFGAKKRTKRNIHLT